MREPEATTGRVRAEPIAGQGSAGGAARFRTAALAGHLPGRPPAPATPASRSLSLAGAEAQARSSPRMNTSPATPRGQLFWGQPKPLLSTLTEPASSCHQSLQLPGRGLLPVLALSVPASAPTLPPSSAAPRRPLHPPLSPLLPSPSPPPRPHPLPSPPPLRGPPPFCPPLWPPPQPRAPRLQSPRCVSPLQRPPLPTLVVPESPLLIPPSFPSPTPPPSGLPSPLPHPHPRAWQPVAWPQAEQILPIGQPRAGFLPLEGLPPELTL